jgi:hypothetical protein
MATPIKYCNKIQYLAQQNLQSEQKIQRNWYREVIAQYGIPTVYYRTDNNFTAMLSTIYGERPNVDYFLSANMNVYLDMNQDIILLNKFGLQTDAEAIAYVLRDDFYEQFRDTLGEFTSANMLLTDIANKGGNAKATYTSQLIVLASIGTTNPSLSFKLQ